MADAEVKFKASVETKTAMKELASLEKQFQKQQNVLEQLDTKLRVFQKVRSDAYRAEKSEAKAALDAEKANLKMLETNYDRVTQKLGQYSDKYKKLKQFEDTKRLNSGLIAAYKKNNGISDESYQTYKNLLKQQNTYSGSIGATKFAVKEAQYKYDNVQPQAPSQKEQILGDTYEVQAEKADRLAESVERAKQKVLALSEADRKAAEEAARQAEEEKRQAEAAEIAQQRMERFKSAISAVGAGAKKAFYGIAVGGLKAVGRGAKKLLPDFKGLTKAVRGFGNRLKTAILQGLIFRNLRQVLSKFMQTLGQTLLLNKGFADSFANLKGTAWTAFAPILEALVPILTKFMNVLAMLITYVSTFINLLFGLAGASNKAGKALANQASAASGAAKETKKNFASFDTVEQLNKKDTSGGSGTTSPTFAQDWETASTALDKIKEKIAANDWFGVGMEMGAALNNILDIIDNFITEKLAPKLNTFSKYFADWVNGLVEGTDFTKIGQIVVDSFYAIVDAANTFLETIDTRNIGKKIADFFNTLISGFDAGKIATLLGNILKRMYEFLIGFIEGLDWNALGKKIVTSIVDFVTTFDWKGLVMDMAEYLGAAFGALWGLAFGIAEEIWGLISAAWDIAVEWWKDVAYEDGQFTMEGLLEGIREKLKDIEKWIKDNVFKPFLDGFKKAFGIASPSKEMKEQGAFISEGMLEGIKNGLSNVEQWIKENIFDPIVNKVKSIFGIGADGSKTFKDIGKDIIDGLKNGLKSGLNGIIGVMNTIIDVVEQAVNYIVDRINTLSWEVPDWVPLIGGKTFGFNIPHTSIPRIPELAQGTVVNPNHRFAAILGDNKQEQEIVSPLSTMKQALLEALQEGGYGSTQAPVLQIDGTTVARIMNPYYERVNTKIGVRATGGAV